MNLVPHDARPFAAPAAMSHDKLMALAVAHNKLEPRGAGFVIAKADAVSDLRRQEFEVRVRELRSRLEPAGQVYAARRLGEMGNTMRKRNVSQREADLDFAKMVDGVLNQPAFAIDAAAADFERGAVGDHWMPRLADFHPHVLAKAQLWRAELRQIERLLAAEVVEVKSDPERKARLLAEARTTTAAMPDAGRTAEAERVGRPLPDPHGRAPTLAELQARAAEPIAPLSAEAAPLYGEAGDIGDYPQEGR